MSRIPSPAAESGRVIPLEGTDNFRDLGGYRTADGRRIRRGVLYRSGHLGKLTDADMEHLASLDLKRIVDFRGPVEKEENPNRIPGGAEYIQRPVDVAGTDVREEFKAWLKGRPAADPGLYLYDVNRRFVRDYSSMFAEWLRDLARNDDAVPQVYHCTAGKDRTGFASALLLRILGASEQTVMEDYLLSEICMAESIEGMLRQIARHYPIPGIRKKARPLMGVDARYLQTAFDTIDEDWGNLETFIRNGLGLTDDDEEALKSRFLE